MKLNEAIEKYRKYVKVTRSPGTLKYLDGKIGILRKYLGHKECNKINTDVVLDFIIEQQQRNPNISNRTINKYVQTIKQVLQYSCSITLAFENLPIVKKSFKSYLSQL